jgi:hypothetical protein
MKIHDFICPETGDTNCLCCTGEACGYCGAGCGNNQPRNCQHDVITRHLPPSDIINFMDMPLDHPAWKQGPL